MKWIALAVCAFFILAPVSVTWAEPFSPQWEWKKKKRAGKVKTITTYRGKRKRVAYYDKKGFLDKEESYNEEGKLMGRAECFRGRKGRLDRVSMYNSKGRKVYDEDAEYRKDKIVFLERSGEWKKARFLYDKKGNILEIITVRPNGLDGEKWVFSYDKKGRLIENHRVNHKGLLHSRRKLEYNKKGDLHKRFIYDDRDELNNVRVYEYEYDKKGNWVKSDILIQGLGDNEGKEVKTTIKREITYH